MRPDIILIDQEGYLKFGEFGNSVVLDGDRTYDFVGVPQYTAPEVFLSQGYDYAADYWSLGVCLYEMICGDLPFKGDSTLEVYKDIHMKSSKGI